MQIQWCRTTNSGYLKMKYYIISASRDHVQKGAENGFAQAGHGKQTRLKKLEKGDWIIYYSSKLKMNDSNPYQKFTAVGQITDGEVFQVEVSDTFKPWRIKADFAKAKDLEIRPLIEKLEFIKNKKKWGFSLMSGFVEIPKADFDLIFNFMVD